MVSKSFAKDEITAIVRKDFREEFEILNWNLEPTKTKTKLLGDHMILSININSQGTERKLNFFVKFLPENEDQLMFVNATRAFHREIFLYKNFFQTCEFIPRFYLSKERHVIVLEDLTQLGFVEIDRTQTLNYSTVSMILQTLTKFHSLSLIYEENKSKQLNKSYRLLDDFSEELEERFYVQRENFIPTTSLTAAMTGVVKIAEYFKLGDKVRENLKKLCEKLVQLAKPSTQYRNVICHGGLWATNFLIKDQSCKLINFQLSRYTPPVQDFLSFLHLTTSREFRSKNLNKLMHFYYEQLKLNMAEADFDLNEAITWTEFQNSGEEQKCFAIIQAVIHLQYACLNNNCLDELLNDADYSQKAFYEDSSVVFFRNVDVDPTYRSRLWEAFEDLKDFCDMAF